MERVWREKRSMLPPFLYIAASLYLALAPKRNRNESKQQVDPSKPCACGASIAMTKAFAPTRTMHIDFHLDLICPWCWIGLRHLRAAWNTMRAQRPDLPMALRWRANSLLPHIPQQGVPYQTFYVARLGSKEAVAARRAQIQAVAQSVNLTLNFGAIPTFPNTRLVCTVVHLAQEQLATDAMFGFVESLFSAFFVQGRDIGSVDTLRSLAHAAGLDWDAARLGAEPLLRWEGSVGGVPHVVIDDQWSLTGARPAAELLQLMVQSADAAMPHD